MPATKRKTRLPKGMTKTYWTTKNMPAELLNQARQVAGLRTAAGMKGNTIESVVIDALITALPTLEKQAIDTRKAS